ncbi:MAG: DUF1737 domain-containing protein [Terriglobales bacterium]|jgi:uncharacterized protein DUF1737
MASAITEYTIVNGTTDIELIRVVVAQIRNGWRPIGGPVTAQDQNGQGKLLQALVR